MKATRLILAAGLAIVTSTAFAETGVKTYRLDHVSNIYGRTGVAAVQIRGAVQSGNTDVANAGRNVPNIAGQGTVNLNTADVNTFGRS
jgi:hypothetical protein